MKSLLPTRRKFLKATVATTGVAVFSSFLPGLQVLAHHQPPIRRSLGALGPDHDDVTTYRDFVRIMKAESNSNPFSWNQFALIHGTTAGFNKCPHGSWYFLPWHRAYVQMYERACRVVTNNPDFAMPYWDWTEQRGIPEAFHQGAVVNNALHEPSRTMSESASLPDWMVGEEVMHSIYEESNFEAFGTTRPAGQNNLDPAWVTGGGGVQGTLEATPHNNVHVTVGGVMGGYRSPLDPLFQMHHGNIDRIWDNWIALCNKNSTDTLWLDMPFTDNFTHPTGSSYSATVRNLLDTKALGYQYETQRKTCRRFPILDRRIDILDKFFAFREQKRPDLPKGPLPPNCVQGLTCPPDFFRIDNNTRLSTGKPLSMKIQLEERFEKMGRPTLKIAGKALSEGRESENYNEVLAVLRNITPPNDPRTTLRIFLNHPRPSLKTSTDNRHYVTTIGFFGKHNEGSHQKAKMSYLLNLTDTLSLLAQSGKLRSNDLSIQIVMVPPQGVDKREVGYVQPEGIDVAII